MFTLINLHARKSTDNNLRIQCSIITSILNILAIYTFAIFSLTLNHNIISFFTKFILLYNYKCREKYNSDHSARNSSEDKTMMSSSNLQIVTWLHLNLQNVQM